MAICSYKSVTLRWMWAVQSVCFLSVWILITMAFFYTLRNTDCSLILLTSLSGTGGLWHQQLWPRNELCGWGILPFFLWFLLCPCLHICVENLSIILKYLFICLLYSVTQRLLLDIKFKEQLLQSVSPLLLTGTLDMKIAHTPTCKLITVFFVSSLHHSMTSLFLVLWYQKITVQFENQLHKGFKKSYSFDHGFVHTFPDYNFENLLYIHSLHVMGQFHFSLNQFCLFYVKKSFIWLSSS